MPAIVNEFCQAKAPKAKTDAPKQCVVSFPEFVRNANQVAAEIAGGTIQCKPYEFKTLTFGWTGCGKVNVRLANGQVVNCQVDIKLFVANSKNADRTTPAAPRMTDEQVDAAEKADAADVQ